MKNFFISLFAWVGSQSKTTIASLLSLLFVFVSLVVFLINTKLFNVLTFFLLAALAFNQLAFILKKK